MTAHRVCRPERAPRLQFTCCPNVETVPATSTGILSAL